MTQSEVALIGTTATAVVTVCGWSVSHILATRRTDRTRRLELALHYAERQIEELYGPMLALIEQIFTVWKVRERVMHPNGREARTGPETPRLVEFFQQQYFFPLHERLREILATKLHLIDGSIVPKSFYVYLEHSTQQIIQRRLYTELGTDTSDVSGVSWPPELYDDIKDALERLTARYDDYLTDLEVLGVYRQQRLPNSRAGKN